MVRLFLVLPLIVACASPAPEFFGAARYEVTKDGVDFVVFHRGSVAEVVRLGYLTRSRRAGVPQLMQSAAAEATGCRVVRGSMRTKIPGDTGEARFDLDCRGAG